MLGGPVKGALYYFKIAIALAVAAIPEGLPAVITTCLALGTRRMTANNAIIKKLPSVETLGCTTVICSDKTGTLTLNKMVAKELVMFGDDETDFIQCKVASKRYEPEGEITGGRIEGDQVKMFIQSVLVNSTCKLVMKDGAATPIGTPTEGALLALASKMRQFTSDKATDGLKYIKEVQQKFVLKNINSFDSKRKMMSVLARSTASSDNILFVKGAPERMVDSTSHVLLRNGTEQKVSNAQKDKIDSQIQALASRGLRVLAIGYKKEIGEMKSFNGIDDRNHPSLEFLKNPENYSELEKDIVLLGLVGIKDPLRPEVHGAIQQCKNAGICVFMVTGDNVNTAVAIAKSAGIVNDQTAKNNTLLGSEFEKQLDTSPEKLKQKLLEAIKRGQGMVFARTAPRHKMRLVKVLKSINQVVAMTGDGVNDAPALVQAHIGIAMGIAGTEVAKECSSMILLDDNFATIVKAVEEGRGIYENMKAFIRYMISSNVGEVISIFFSSIMGLPDGFNSIQLLWVNLVTDGIPAMALSFNPPDADIMVKPPRSNDDGIVDLWVLTRYLAVGIYIGVATVGIFMYWYMYYDWAGDNHSMIEFSKLSRWTTCPEWKGFSANNFAGFNFEEHPCSYFTVGKAKASTLSLSVLVMIEMFNAFNAISENQSLLSTGIMINPYLVVGVISTILLHCVILYIPSLNFLFSTMPLDFNDWFLVVAFSFPVIIIDEILKVFSRQRLQRQIDERMSQKNN